MSRPSTPPERILDIDLTGSRLGEGWRSARISGVWPGTDEQLRRMAAEHHGVPVEQVTVLPGAEIEREAIRSYDGDFIAGLIAPGWDLAHEDIRDQYRRRACAQLCGGPDDPHPDNDISGDPAGHSRPRRWWPIGG